ncbi:hypothetical protein FOA52_012170 [Chlamydomonas sp. UWO 241]|nr:hypothetical protein FOA52_012170 [Chlamydomonas sp. UWO 241]
MTPQNASNTQQSFIMGLIDHASPLVKRCLVGFTLAAFLGICVAMCVAPPQTWLADYQAPYGDYAASPIDNSAICWMLTSSALVLIMTPGVAFFYGGMINSKNVVATIATAILPMCIIPIMWSFVGFSFAFGEDVGGIFGNPATYGLMYNVNAQPFSITPWLTTSTWFIFQGMFAIITPAIIVGAISDRANFAALCLFIPIWHILVYCPITHMVWGGGIIAQWGLLDFAGGMVVHMSSGYSALAAAYFVGPSKRTTKEGPANVPYVVLGTALLWFGWFGFNAGSAFGATAYAAHAFLNTNIATAASMLSWMLMDQLQGHKFKTVGMCLGIVVGLVGITPAAGIVNPGAAMIIGIITAIVCSSTQMLMAKWGRAVAEDTLDVFACHGMGGTVGMILTSLFQSVNAGAWDGLDGAFYGRPVELGKCIAVLLALMVWYTVTTYLILSFVNLIITVRVSEEEELEGLDVSKHGENNYIPPGEAVKVTMT